MLLKCKFFLFVFFLLFFASFSQASAQVVINEFLPNPSSGDDWVELYSPADVDISNWILDDDNTSTDMATIPQGTVIGPSTNLFYSVDVGKRLNKSKDTVYLYLSSKGNPVDSHSYDYNPGTGVSFGRFPDGEMWGTCFPTKDTPNSSCSFPSPSPSPTPTPTPSPSPTSSSTPTPTQTPTPTPTPTPTVKAAATAKSEPKTTKKKKVEEGQGEKELILGLREGLGSPSPSPTAASEEKKKFPAVAALLIFGGLGFLGTAAYPFLKKIKKGYNIEGEQDNGKDS